MGLLKSFLKTPDLEVESREADGSTIYICRFQDREVQLEYHRENHEVTVKSEALDVTPDAHSTTVDSRLKELGVVLHKKKYRDVEAGEVHVDLFEGSGVKLRDTEDRVKTVIQPA